MAVKANKKGTDYSLTTLTYRGQDFSVKRTPGAENTGPAADYIVMLEAQLEKCYTALIADSVGAVCPASQKAAIKASQAYIANAQPSWNLKPYRAELAFYEAEDARRQRAAGAPAK
ncbi:hypothetical protein [Hymenobacter sp. B1770]|uniref:hypothetical protein n=1 Tax=Hymenobacter sp. B1770 TaxID=1718788 RepID=UPI003CE9600C